MVRGGMNDQGEKDGDPSGGPCSSNSSSVHHLPPECGFSGLDPSFFILVSAFPVSEDYLLISVPSCVSGNGPSLFPFSAWAPSQPVSISLPMVLVWSTSLFLSLAGCLCLCPGLWHWQGAVASPGRNPSRTSRRLRTPCWG